MNQKTINFINKAKEVHGDKYDYSKTEYIASKLKVIIICPEHGEFEQRGSAHLSGNGCRKCISDKQKLRKSDFINKAKEVHGDKYDYSKVEYINYDTNVIIMCPEHGEFQQTPNNHIKGSHCLMCSFNSRKLGKDTFIKRSIKIHGDKYDYSKVEYQNAHTKVKIICPEHGEFQQTPHDHFKGKGCPRCRESKGEKTIRNYLIENNINFEPQHRFDDCRNIKPLPFDFYLPNLNMCIEYNGIQHYKVVEQFGGEEGFRQTQINDDLKKRYCEEKKIKLVIIKYNHNIINVLKSIR